jgi:hypothetical protein
VCGSVVRNFCDVLLQKQCTFVHPSAVPYSQNFCCKNYSDSLCI